MAEEELNEEVEQDEQYDTGLEGVAALRTHELINRRYCGDLNELKEGYAKVSLITNDEMRVDTHGLVHGGFVFSGADFAAMAAVNDPNVVLSAANTSFLSPVRVGDEVTFKATVRHKEGRKREVNVLGYVLDIKVFEGIFKTVVLEKHVLKLNLMNASKTD